MTRRLKKRKPEVHWKETPEWQRNVRSVLKLKERGFELSQISAVSNLEIMTVNRIIEEEEVNQSIIKSIWSKKIPVMQDIVGMGLDGIRETLKDMSDPEVRRTMIGSVQDLTALTRVVESLNMLLRLEEGKSTANVANKYTHSYIETRAALQELSKVDPVFDYPKTEISLAPVVIDKDPDDDL